MYAIAMECDRLSLCLYLWLALSFNTTVVRYAICGMLVCEPYRFLRMRSGAQLHIIQNAKGFALLLLLLQQQHVVIGRR